MFGTKGKFNLILHFSFFAEGLTVGCHSVSAAKKINYIDLYFFEVSFFKFLYHSLGHLNESTPIFAPGRLDYFILDVTAKGKFYFDIVPHLSCRKCCLVYPSS